jgi:hypothetical protein
MRLNGNWTKELYKSKDLKVEMSTEKIIESNSQKERVDYYLSNKLKANITWRNR